MKNRFPPHSGASPARLLATSYSLAAAIQMEGEVKEGILSDDELEGLSVKITAKWKQLGLRLGIRERELAAFDKENEELSEKAYRMLLYWKRMKGPRATYRDLYDALCHDFVNRIDLAEEFCIQIYGHAPRRVKEGIPSDDDLERLSVNITAKWKQLGRRLGISEARLVTFDHECEIFSEKAYQMLMHWKQMKGSAATYRDLHDALCHNFVLRRDLAEEFCIQIYGHAPRGVKEGTPNNEDLERLSQTIGEVWKKIGRRLKIDYARLEEFQAENEKLSEKAYHMLLFWKNRDGSAATYQVLYEALCHKLVNRLDLAEEFCSQISGTAAPGEEDSSTILAAKRMKLPVKEGTPDDEDLERLSKKIGVFWKKIGRRLKIDYARLEEFQEENEELSGKAFRMLLFWKDRDGSAATYQGLYEALCHKSVNRKSLAEEFCFQSSGTAAPGEPSLVPKEIQERGHEAEIAFQNAMQHGEVQVYRGRVMFIGQDGAGKTSLKNYLLGIPFNPQEDSTAGIEIDPSKFEVEVDQVKNWQRTEQKAFGVHEIDDNIPMLIATELEQNSRSEEENVTAKDAGTINSVRAAPSSKKLKSGTMQENDTEATMQNDLPSENVIKSGLPDLDIDTKLVFSNDLMEQVMRCLDHQKLKDDIKAKEYTLNMWDFAGQHIYYASHPVFLSSRAVYILVCNLNKDLNAVAEPCVRQGTVKPLENPNKETNLENLLSWLVSVYRLRPKKNDVVCSTDGKPYYVRPPVFIVGTHAAHPAGGDVNKMLSCIEESLTEMKEVPKHVIRPFYSVDNTRSLGDDDLEELRKKIQEVLFLEPYMGEKIPIRWFHFEKIVQALVKEKIYHVKLEDLQSTIRQYCGIDDKDEMALMLDFYHDLGEIVKHGSTVVMQTKWLINLFKQLIAVRPFKDAAPVISHCWDELQKSGILKMELIDHVFYHHIERGLDKEDILNLMELYGLIAKFVPDSTTEKPRYFVPAQITTPPPKSCEKKSSDSDPCSLYLNFPDGFVPHGLFTQLLSKCIVWGSERGFLKEPKLFQCGASFLIGKEKQTIHKLVLICRKRSIKVALTQHNLSSKAPKELEPGEVRVFLDETLADFSEKLPWLRGLKYEWCVACTVCQCDKHGVPLCVHEECLHLHPVDSPEALIICEDSDDAEIGVKVHGLDKWFQVTQESKIEGEGKTNHFSAADGSDPHLKRKASSTSTQDPGESASKSRRLSDKSCTQESKQTTLEVVESEDEPAAKQRSSEEAKSSNTQTTSGARTVKSDKPTDDELDSLSRLLGNDWEPLVRKLFPENEAKAKFDKFDTENKRLEEKSFRMLEHWKQKNGSDATYEVLYQALSEIRKDLAERFCLI